MKKIPKICQNKETCTWKPRCKYVHPEDGESLPVRQARVLTTPQRSQGHQGQAQSQNFGSPKMVHHPPSWSQIPPPAYQSQEHIMENIQQKIQEMMVNVIVPNLMSLSQFPNIRKK